MLNECVLIPLVDEDETKGRLQLDCKHTFLNRNTDNSL